MITTRLSALAHSAIPTAAASERRDFAGRPQAPLPVARGWRQRSIWRSVRRHPQDDKAEALGNRATRDRQAPNLRE